MMEENNQPATSEYIYFLIKSGRCCKRGCLREDFVRQPVPKAAKMQGAGELCIVTSTFIYTASKLPGSGEMAFPSNTTFAPTSQSLNERILE